MTLAHGNRRLDAAIEGTLFAVVLTAHIPWLIRWWWRNHDTPRGPLEWAGWAWTYACRAIGLGPEEATG